MGEPTDPPPVLQPSELCSDNPSSDITTFSDAHLEVAVRDQLWVGAQEDLTCDLLSGVTTLVAHSSRIGDLGGIESLTSLRGLYLPSNSIIDISALSGLTSLSSLRLDNNPDLTGIQPLLANTGLGTGDGVNLWNTNVNCTDVTALEAKGVTVSAPHCR